jgi:DnaJ-class molecular chaperone
MTKLKRQHQECIGCGNHFTTFKNYDYCPDCAVNGNRYLLKSNCPECDGSGMIKFRGQKPRLCKLCYLTKKPMNKIKKLTAEEQEEQF